MRAATLILILAMALAACGGDETTDTADTTTSSESTTSPVGSTVTTAVDEDDGSDDGGLVDLDDMPQECIDVFVDFLRAMEPAVEGFDFTTATADDMETLGAELESVTTDYATDIESLDCPEPDEEAFAAMIAIAEREAPGTVAYLEWIQSFALGDDSLGSASGDCETDITAMQEIVDLYPSMGELPMENVLEAGALMTSISTVCSAERAGEFFAQEDVAAFTSG
jgi:hypothetical protein